MRDGLFPPSKLTHDVDGVQFTFRPISVGAAFKMKDLIKPIALTVAGVFSSMQALNPAVAKVTSSKSTKTNIKGGDSQAVEEYTVKDGAIDLDVVEFQNKKWERVIDSVMACLSDEKNLQVVCDVVYESIKKDNFDAEGNGAFSSGQDIKENCPLPAIVGLVIGAVKANAKVFGPLAPRLVAEMSRKLQPQTSHSETATPLFDSVEQPSAPAETADSLPIQTAGLVTIKMTPEPAPMDG